MRKFVIVKNVEVSGVNAKSSEITIGIPSITAFCGFGEALSLNTDLQVKSVSVGSVYFKVRGSGWNYSDTKITWQDKGVDKKKLVGNPPFQRQPKADAIFTLCFEIDTQLSAEDIESQVKRFLNQGRLAGGTIGKYEKVFAKVAMDRDSLAGVKNSMMPCYLLLDRDVEGDIFTDAVNRRLSPMVNGYRKLKEVVDKTQLRDKVTPAYFVEPTYTMVGYKMASNVDDFDEALWAYSGNNKIETIGGIYYGED